MNSDRLIFNPEDTSQIFVPISVEEERRKSSEFWKPHKRGILFLVIILTPLINMMLNVNIVVRILFNAVLLLLWTILIRISVLDEKYITNVYRLIAKYKKSTSGIFWGIAFIKEMAAGTMAYFMGGIVGVFIRPERGSVIGQEDDFIEQHIDNISDFYKGLYDNELSSIYANTMEKAIKDDRLEKISKRIKNEKNIMLKEMLEYNLRKIKGIAETTLYETDTMLVYSTDNKRMEAITEKAMEVGQNLVGAAYRKIETLDEKEIIDFHKEINDIEYFNITNAKSDLFDDESKKDEIILINATLENGNVIELRKKENDIINNCYNMHKYNDITIDILQELQKSKEAQMVEMNTETKQEEQIVEIEDVKVEPKKEVISDDEDLENIEL